MRNIRPSPAEQDLQLRFAARTPVSLRADLPARCRTDTGWLRSGFVCFGCGSQCRPRTFGAISDGGIRNPAARFHDPGHQGRGFTMMGKPAFQNDPGTIMRLPVDNPTLPLLLMILGDFRRQAISYCYWKSSRRIPSVLAGGGDLDLLIARHDQHRADAILLERGFKPFPSVAMRDHPAILSYLGYDEPSGRLVHLHLHFRLVVGERLHKNYRIPWETEILARAIPHPALPVKILGPASEAVLLGVRACLELRRLDPVTLRGWRTTLARFALDRRRLAETLDHAQLSSRASELLGEDIGAMLTGAIYGERSLEGS